MKMLEYFTQIVFEFGIKKWKGKHAGNQKIVYRIRLFKINVLNKSGIPKCVF